MRAYIESRQGWKVEEATAAETFVTEQSLAFKRDWTMRSGGSPNTRRSP